jgi:predicted nucleic acid-binding protein
MNTALIADSSGIISLVSVTDRNHPIAVSASEKFLKVKGAILVPSDVFSETLNIMGKKAGHAFAVQTATILLEEPAFIIVEAHVTLREQALAKFHTQKEQVSFTDCIVMALADQFASKTIFGFDEVFKRNGYTALPGL